MPDIFISYRRGDSAGHAGRLYDGLVSRFADSQVFIDVDAIAPGIDFVQRIQEAVQSCDVVLVLIGEEWVSMKGRDGTRRLDDAEDFVRLEIAAALERGVPLVPVLVEGARMPDASALPENIRGLARQNAIELSDARWHYDVSRLIEAVSRLSPEETQPSRDTKQRAPAAAGANRRPLMIGGAIALLAVVGALVAVMSGGSGEEPAPPARTDTNSRGFSGGDNPLPAAAGGISSLAGGLGALWGADYGKGTVQQYDGETGKPVGKAISVGKGLSGVAVGQNAVWAISSDEKAVIKLDANTGERTSTTLQAPRFIQHVAAGAGAVWLTVEGDPGLLRYDPSTGEQVAGISGTGLTASVTTGDFSTVAVTAQGRAVLVDADSNKVTGRFPVGDTADGLAFDAEGGLWVASPSGHVVHFSGGEAVKIPLGGGPREIATTSSAVWVLDTEEGMLYEVDPATDQVAGPGQELGEGTSSIAAVDDRVWVGFSDGRLQRVAG